MTEELEAIAKRLVVRQKRDGRSVYDPHAKPELLSLARQPGPCGVSRRYRDVAVRTAATHMRVNMGSMHFGWSAAVIRRPLRQD